MYRDPSSEPVSRPRGTDGTDTPLTVLTLNLHKGFTAMNRRFVLPALKAAVQQCNADVVFLQEVLGQHDTHAQRVHGWPAQSQYEYLADSIWRDFAYGRNAVYPQGHHGNAVLSKFPIVAWRNQDVSVHAIEKRGLLHGELEWKARGKTLHVICAHLGLLESQRQEQLRRLVALINERVPSDAPLIVAGDLNDWRQRGHPALLRAGLQEVHHTLRGRLARTFPARMPVLPLDRVYIRHLAPVSVRVLSQAPWNRLSDHAAVLAEVA